MKNRKKQYSLEAAVRELIQERNSLLRQRDVIAQELLDMKEEIGEEPVIYLAGEDDDFSLVETETDEGVASKGVDDEFPHGTLGLEKIDVLSTPEGQRGQAVQHLAEAVGVAYMSGLVMKLHGDHNELTHEEEQAVEVAVSRFRSQLHKIANDIARKGLVRSEST